MGHNLTEYKESESKFHQNNIQADIYEAFQKRLSNEAKHLADPSKRLSPEFKSYQEFFNAKVSLWCEIVNHVCVVASVRNPD